MRVSGRPIGQFVVGVRLVDFDTASERRRRSPRHQFPSLFRVGRQVGLHRDLAALQDLVRHFISRRPDHVSLGPIHGTREIEINDLVGMRNAAEFFDGKRLDHRANMGRASRP